MIEKGELGVFMVCCDSSHCSNFDEYDVGGDFDYLRKEMKKSGWVSQKTNGVWYNFCPVCSGNEEGELINDEKTVEESYEGDLGEEKEEGSFEGEA